MLRAAECTGEGAEEPGGPPSHLRVWWTPSDTTAPERGGSDCSQGSEQGVCMMIMSVTCIYAVDCPVALFQDLRGFVGSFTQGTFVKHLLCASAGDSMKEPSSSVPVPASTQAGRLYPWAHLEKQIPCFPLYSEPSPTAGSHSPLPLGLVGQR